MRVRIMSFIFFNIGAVCNKICSNLLFSAGHKIRKILDSLIKMDKTQLLTLFCKAPYTEMSWKCIE